MKLRARWEGPLPEVGDVLKGVGPRVRAAYVITGIRIVERVLMRYEELEVDDGRTVEVESYASQVTRAVFEVERVPIADIPPNVAIHAWRWDRRDRKPL